MFLLVEPSPTTIKEINAHQALSWPHDDGDEGFLQIHQIIIIFQHLQFTDSKLT